MLPQKAMPSDLMPRRRLESFVPADNFAPFRRMSDSRSTQKPNVDTRFDQPTFSSEWGRATHVESFPNPSQVLETER
jgi:hypothetical protein